MVKLLLTAPHTQTHLSRAAVKLANLLHYQFLSFSCYCQFCGITLERNGEGEKTRAFVLVIHVSWSSVATFTWLPCARKNSSKSSTAFPKGWSQCRSSLGPAAETPIVESSGCIFQRIKELHAHQQHWELDKRRRAVSDLLVLWVRSSSRSGSGGNFSRSSQLLCSRGDTSRDTRPCWSPGWCLWPAGYRALKS